MPKLHSNRETNTAALVIVFVFLSVQATAQPLSEIQRSLIKAQGRVESDLSTIPSDVAVLAFLQAYKGEYSSHFSHKDRELLLKSIRKISWLDGLYFSLEPLFVQNSICVAVRQDESRAAVQSMMDEFEYSRKKYLVNVVQDLNAALTEHGRSIIEMTLANSTYGDKSENHQATSPTFENSSAFISRLKSRCEAAHLYGIYIEETRSMEKQITARVKYIK
jgi:hypothetical protein